ncbi:family 78 glycoside hydrolase catalytic domain [Rhizosphaericola mali]|nr:family 78 glycoside hydrolase catalytic domain [Rhizosphaericola mali]
MKFLLNILFLGLFVQCSAQITTVNLLCEHLNNPLGINTAQPSFSWEIISKERNVVQVSYQILVASSADKLNQEKADLWNSNEIIGDVSNYIKYSGKKLQSGQKAYWIVKVTTNKGASSWSKLQYFNIGLLHNSDWKGKWIGYDQASSWDSISQWSRLSARYFRKEFSTKENKIKRATIYIAGLGLYKLSINGQKIGDQVLAPAPTDYRKTVLYNTFDVTNILQKGKNAIGVILSNGRFFTMRQNYKPKKIANFGYPKLLFQLELEYSDGRKEIITSNKSWKYNSDGAIRTANEYDGEEYDANKEWKNWNTIGFDDAKWSKVQLVSSSGGLLTAQMTAPMKVMKKIKPIDIHKLSDGKFVVDFGQNFAGWVELKVKAKNGDKITMRFAESLQKDGSIYTENLRDARSTDVYIAKGVGEEIWQPSFVYHGFRYVEVSGYPQTPSLGDFEGQLVYDDMQTVGTLNTSNATINQIVKNAWWTIASDYKGMPVDCPQRNERQPWLGDRTTGSYGESFLFDNKNLYTKWLDDIRDAQTSKGSIPDVAPAYWNYYTDNVAWPSTYFFVANMLYRQYGDVEVIKKHYPNMKKWVLYMDSAYVKNNLIARDKYGDWCVPPENIFITKSQDSSLTTNGTLIASSYYYQVLRFMYDFAILSQNYKDTSFYNNLSSNIKTAFNKKFLNAKKALYDNNSLTANILPLSFNIVPDSLRDKVFDNVYKKIKIDHHMHIGTGVIGTQWIMRTLNQFGRSDISYTLATNKTYPSWGYMIENGASTIWELWNGNTASPKMNSQNHVMLLGDLLIWLYENVAGIKSDSSAIAFKKIIMKLEIIDGLDSVNASYKSVYGEIKSHWIKTINSFSWDITVPTNTTAQISVPAYALEWIKESGKSIQGNKDVSFVKMDGAYAILKIGSGNYRFESTFPFKKGIKKSEFIFTQVKFPESHSSTIAETPKGLIASWFGGTKEGNKDVCIYTSKLEDGKWTSPDSVADGVKNDSLRYACYNPVLYQIPGKELLLFYKIGANVGSWKGWMKRSFDNGITWSVPDSLPFGYLGPIKNKPVLVNNALICPSSTENNGWKVHFEYTKDWGKTWTKSENINDGKTISAIQPSILTYSDGRLQVLCRSQNRTINESWSKDNGYSWSPMTQTSMPNNNSGTDAVTLSNGWQLLVYNHVKPDIKLPKGKGARTPLNVAISKDGVKWYAALVLEDSPISQYSYPSFIQSKDGKVHIVYTWRRERIKHVEIDPAELELHEIVDGVWPVVKP